MAVTNQEILAYTRSLEAQGLSSAEVEAELYRAAKQYDVNLSQIENALGMEKGAATKYVTDNKLQKDWATELTSRGGDSVTDAYRFAQETGITSNEAARIAEAVAGEDKSVYNIDEFGKAQELGLLNATNLEDQILQYRLFDTMMNTNYGSKYSDAAIPEMYDYSQRYGIGSQPIANWLSAHTGSPVSSDVVDQAVLDRYGSQGMLAGSQSWTPTPVQATGQINYAAYDKRPDETLTQYYDRLSNGRAGGVLGTRDLTSGMFQLGAPTPDSPQDNADTVAAAMASNEATGNYSSEIGSNGVGSNQDFYDMQRWLLDNPAAITAINALLPFGGFGLLGEDKIQASVWNALNEATKDQGFWNYLMEQDGDVVLGDRGTGSGSLVTGEASPDISWDPNTDVFNPADFTDGYGQSPTGVTSSTATSYPVNMNTSITEGRPYSTDTGFTADPNP